MAGLAHIEAGDPAQCGAGCPEGREPPEPSVITLRSYASSSLVGPGLAQETGQQYLDMA